MPDEYFEVPDVNVEGTTFDENEKAISKFNHQMSNPAHPLNPLSRNTDSKHKKALSDYRMKLFEQRAATDETPNEYDVALNEMAVKEQQRIDDIHAAGKRDWFKLKELGYEGADEPPSVISADQARLYLMQRLNAEGTQSGINELGNMVSQDMRKYNKTQELSSLFDTLMNTDLDADLRQEIGHKIIAYLDALRRDALEKKPTKQASFETFKSEHGITGEQYG